MPDCHPGMVRVEAWCPFLNNSPAGVAMSRTAVFAAIILTFFRGSLLAEPGEHTMIPKALEELPDAAVNSKNPSVAVSALGLYLETGGDMGSAVTAKTIIEFSRKRSIGHKAIVLPAFYDVDKLTPNILKAADGELAAQIIAARAYLNILAAPDAQPVIRKKGNAKKKKGSGTPGDMQAFKPKIPDDLFRSKSRTSQYLAILAAAYSQQPEYQAQVEGVQDSTGEIMAAKILYQVMLGKTPDDKAIANAYAKCLIQSGRPIEGDSTRLSEVDMNVPGMATLMEAVGRAGDEKYLELAVKSLTFKDERVRIDAVRALRRIGDPRTVPALAGVLEHASWPQLIEICLALGEMPAKESIEPLMRRFKAETGRFRLDVNYALSSIAGERKGIVAEEWAKWWAASKTSFVVDAAKSAAFREKVRLQDVGVMQNGIFYSIGIYSDHCAFAVDFSNSMQGDQIKSLREKMKDAISGLRDSVYFNIIDFGGDVNVMCPGTLTRNKNKADTYIYDARLTGGTRSMDAIDQGMFLPGVDTLYFLSDGAPIRGQMDNWRGIHALIRFQNRYRPVAISTICFKGGKKNAVSMAEMARQNYGHTEEIE